CGPAAAAGWGGPRGGREGGWSIGKIVGHIGATRLYFASAYGGEGWLTFEPEIDTDDQRTWIPWLEMSARRFHERLQDTPNEWLNRRIEMIDTPGATLSGWRLLMMMVEHEVHHRSQIDSYAGLEGWPVPHIFNRSAESIVALQHDQRTRHGA